MSNMSYMSICSDKSSNYIIKEDNMIQNKVLLYELYNNSGSSNINGIGNYSNVKNNNGNRSNITNIGNNCNNRRRTIIINNSTNSKSHISHNMSLPEISNIKQNHNSNIIDPINQKQQPEHHFNKLSFNLKELNTDRNSISNKLSENIKSNFGVTFAKQMGRFDNSKRLKYIKSDISDYMLRIKIDTANVIDKGVNLKDIADRVDKNRDINRYETAKLFYLS